MARVECSELAISAAQDKQAGTAAHAETSNVAMRSELAASSEAAPDKLRLTAEERGKVKAAVGAITSIPLPVKAQQPLQPATRAVDTEMAVLHARAAQLEQVLLQTTGDRARLSLELEASEAECARQKELAARMQEVSKQISSLQLEILADNPDTT